MVSVCISNFLKLFSTICRMSINLFADSETNYSVVFNKALGHKGLKKKKRKDGDSDVEDGADGPIIERRCPKCGHERMSYAALQLRFVLSFNHTVSPRFTTFSLL